MDYDDDELQGQNRQLAGEGCSKVSPVLHPYALPKFEFDDTLHGPLNFNSLVENEVFLGQEDNQWIEEYSRGSSGIEFNSSAVELRRTNVWSEATSSESVEMLLKSVGQEEKVVGKAVVEQLDPNICDETVTLTKAMDPNLSQESLKPSGELESVITNEKHCLSVSGEKVDSTFDDVILKEPSKDYSDSLENVGASVEEFNVIGWSKCATSDAAEESIQIKENKKDIPIDNNTVIVESCIYGAEKSLSFVANAEYVDKPSAVTDNSFTENLSAETSTPFNENLSAETSIPFSENPSAEMSNLFSAKLSDENNTPFLNNPSTETSIPVGENPSAENSTPFSEKPPNETSILFSEKLPAEKSISFTENPSAKTSIPFSENPPTETSITFSKKQPTETSIPFSEKPSTQTSISFSEKPPAENNISLSESPSHILKLKDPDSLKFNTGSLSRISPIKISVQENETVISMVSAGNLPEKGCETSGSVQVDCKITSSEPDAVHLDQDDSFNEEGDAKSPLESNDIDSEIVQAVDSQKNVEPSLQVAVSDQRSSPDTVTAEIDELPKSPIFGVSLVHQDSKENTEVGCPSEGNSQNESSQVESVVASVSNNSSASVEKASLGLAEKPVHEINAHCVTPVESCNASQIEQELGIKNDGQDCLKKLEANPFDLSEKTCNISHSGCLQELKEPVIKVHKSNEHQTFVDVACPSEDVAHDSSLPSKIIDDVEPSKITDGVENEVRSVSIGNATPEVKNLSLVVNKTADLGQDGKGSLSYPTFQVSNLSKTTEGPSKGSSSIQIDLRKYHQISISPQSPSGLTSQVGVEGKSERKPRRKSTGKENARKETTPAKDSIRGEISPVLLTPPATGQVTRFEEVKFHANVAKPGVLPSPKIPDLNNSTSIFQQPFSDNQQVQLRAQILVYGSLISGSPPEETHMIAAFGQSDGGRTWEGVWRACLERFHVQKTQPKSSNPIQSRSDMRDAGSRSDQVIKHASNQNKITSSPIGGPSMGTPPLISPVIPFSSPLWNTTTPSSDNLQSSGVAKAASYDYHQILSPLRPTHQTPPPPIPNYNSSWLSQSPFSGQWLPASLLPTFNPIPRIPPFPITESVKLTPVLESGGSMVKHTSNPVVLNSVPITFPEGSSMSGVKRSTVSSDQLSSDSKSRKKIKGIPIVSIPLSTSVAVSVPAFNTSKSTPAKFLSDETSTKVEESKLQAKEATQHADKAIFHCNDVWSQVQRRFDYDLNSNDEAKLVSSAVSVAAAASVAKVAAAAAKIASDVAEQARLMVTKLNKSQNHDQSNAASSSSKHAENLDAIVKAAELAAEAVSQAGKIVAMSEPFSLRDLIEAGPEGYWKTSRLASKPQAFIAENVNVIDKRNTETAPDNQTMEVDGTSVTFTSHEKDKRKPRARKGPEIFKTIGAIPESEIGSIDTSIVGQTKPEIPLGNSKESDIREGCFVEVYKDDDKHNGAWFGANVLSLKDGKALVSYTEIQSDEGKLNEWLPLEAEGSEVPKIRIAHPVTTMQGTRKRRRTAATDFMWSSGDRVDVWMQNHWREGVVMETSNIDTTSLTVHFPAQGEISTVRSWFVRPSLIWKDGKWIMCHTSEKRLSSPGNMPQEKRLKPGSPMVESKRKAGSSENIDLVGQRKQAESRPLSLSTHESIFNVGSTKDNKVKTHRAMRSGVLKEGPGIIFGVPKPGKKQKFMDVSKHYVGDGSNITTRDSIKFTRYLIPHPPGSRGWKRSDPKEKQAAETKPQMLKSRKPPIPSVRTLSSRSKINKSSLDSVGDSENQSGQQIQMEHGSSSSTEDKSERLNKQKLATTTVGKTAKVEKSLPGFVETRRSNRKIQPTSRLLEGLQSSMTISKLPALSHSTQRSHNKITPKDSKQNIQTKEIFSRVNGRKEGSIQE